MVSEDLTLGGKHTMKYTDDVLYNCTLEPVIQIIYPYKLLSNVIYIYIFF